MEAKKQRFISIYIYTQRKEKKGHIGKLEEDSCERRKEKSSKGLKDRSNVYYKCIVV